MIPLILQFLQKSVSIFKAVTPILGLFKSLFYTSHDHPFFLYISRKAILTNMADRTLHPEVAAGDGKGMSSKQMWQAWRLTVFRR
jgi:hypothetical protein